jgi:hypothetical protein
MAKSKASNDTDREILIASSRPLEASAYDPYNIVPKTSLAVARTSLWHLKS